MKGWRFGIDSTAEAWQEWMTMTGDVASVPPAVHGPRSPGGSLVRRLVADNWKVALYVVLIVLCVVFAPEEPLKFIYTEF